MAYHHLYFERKWLRDAGCPFDSQLPFTLQKELYSDLLAFGPNYTEVTELWGYITASYNEDAELINSRLQKAAHDFPPFTASKWMVKDAYQTAARWEPRLNDEDQILIRFWESLSKLTHDWMTGQLKNGVHNRELETIFMMLWSLIVKDVLDGKYITRHPASTMREQVSNLRETWDMEVAA